MKNTLKIAATAALAAAALAATAMPTKRQLAEAQQIVKNLTADDLRALKTKQKTAGEVAAKHLDLAAKADTEAGKYLLLDGAFRLYARGGDYDAAADVLQRMKKDISDIPPELMVELVDGEMRRVAYSKAPKVHAIYSEARRTIKYRKRLTAAEAEAEKRGTSKSFRQLAECHVHLGNWKKALEAFAQACIPAAKWELDPKSVSDYDAFKAAEYWWNYETEEPEPFRAHAVALYRIALDGGLVTGLHSEVVKKRIAEIEALKIPESPLALLYCVIDLSAGSNATNYPVSYLAAEPKGGWTDEYKTTKLVLRRIEPGTFIMGEDQANESHRVTLTKPFYIGVFEVTQKQYELVMGNNPSASKGDTRPVECVLYHMIRGGAKGRQWPASAAVDANSFMGKFRARTRIETFDLPTEAQWEYACRAGTTAPRYDGSDINDFESLMKLGRFLWNQKTRGHREPDSDFKQHKPDGKGGYWENHTSVGLYKPNAWGLFDVYGNVWEYCLDWIGALPYGENPVGAVSGSRRVLRGGSWNFPAQFGHSAYRLPETWRPYFNVGFRLALPLTD